ncbi:CDP-diacylglycerol--serine O-phosphatidyltransferase [Inhella proteolytica]|uniref:CDP-diacylglycerol--serine O-phosphatidyltransferase n=1 Tax=Inhella proteolytica TaxID=2795029 RepID=A0A931J424_9BURK|nr:CDP-diacylglycerol--serine O-phosphatidyltransferase [Inhella proteolytica]MBH9577825.1 CDP-diacylglycerol--serine O-phosphatidyltransferase [Inhella proteolytica]
MSPNPSDPSSDFQDSDLDALAAPVRKPRKGLYVLPNLFTLAALFGGFYAIVMAMNGRYENAAIGIFCAMVLDSLDGRVARMTGTQSAFGEQMDSLSDMVSFGAAPALVAYEWALKDLGKLGWIAAFVYCACAALRLARFNTNIGVIDKRFFQGLPSPAAAALVAGSLWLAVDAGWTVESHPWLSFAMVGITLYAGLTMVTNAPFYSFKDFSLKRSVPFALLVALVLLIALVSSHPPIALFALFCCYSVSGYAEYARRKWKGRHASLIATSTDEPDEAGLHG